MDGSDRVPAGVRFVWEQAESRLEAQMRQADALDSKAGVLVGVHALAAGLIASTAQGLGGAARFVAGAVILGLLVSGWFALRAFRTLRYTRSPRPQELWVFGSRSDQEIKYRFLSTRFEALERNQATLNHKARNVRRSAWILAGVTLGVAISTIVELLT